MSAEDDWDFIEDNYDNDNDFAVDDKKDAPTAKKDDLKKQDSLDELAELDSSKEKKKEPALVAKVKTPTEDDE